LIRPVPRGGIDTAEPEVVLGGAVNQSLKPRGLIFDRPAHGE
jgi:hypothetical protein